MKILEIESISDAISISKNTKWFLESRWFELYTSKGYTFLTLIFDKKKYAIILDGEFHIQEIVDEEDFSVCNQLTEDIINRSIIEWRKKQKKLWNQKVKNSSMI